MTDSLISSLSSLSISSPPTVSHSSSPTPTQWNDSLSSNDSTPKNYKMTKTLVFKPKATGVAAADAPSALMVVANVESETNSGAIAKANGFKDMRLATPELLKEVTGATKDDVSPLSLELNPSSPPSLWVVLDQSLLNDDATLYALRARSDQQTIFLTGKQIDQYLEKTGVKVIKSELKAAPAPSTNTTTPKTAAIAPEQSNNKKTAAKIADAELIGITVHKDKDFPDWYQQVLKKGDMLDYYDVSGCYILKPWSYFVWEQIQAQFDSQIKEMGVSNCYFPMFVSEEVLNKEKDHIEGFAPEVAWVTKAGKSDLERPVAIRPTSETVMYPYYAKWIQSHRDLPLKLNQWNSVVRWEFKHPQPFLRTREFLWQEGHTAHLTLAEADVEVRQILDLYRRVYEELLAVPVIPGVKSEKEKFAGGLYTTTVEGFVPTTGRGIQGGTSHCLGQNFSKMFNIFVDDPKASEEDRGTEKGKAFVWQNSWGLSTRTIGVMVMVHGDDKGLVMPPRVSKIQVVIVPAGIAGLSREEREKMYDVCKETEVKLIKAGIRTKADLRENYTPGFKFSDWELRGVPLRLEIGPKDIAKQSVFSVRRDTSEKKPLKNDGLEKTIKELLDVIHNDMFNKADKEYESRRKVVTDWKDFQTALDGKNHVVIPWCEVEACEDEIKERSARAEVEGEAVDERAPSMGAKSLCIPFQQEKFPDIKGLKCPQCGKEAKRWTMFGRSY